jgi:hypothetical protein
MRTTAASNTFYHLENLLSVEKGNLHSPFLSSSCPSRTSLYLPLEAPTTAPFHSSGWYVSFSHMALL